MNITVFLGAPGSGKGTQAKRLAKTKGFHHLSTGDMLRSATKAGSPVGLKAKSFVERGELVPDQIMIELIEDTLSNLGDDAKILLDGFPRTVPQAEALDKNPKTTVDVAIEFKVPDDKLVERLTGRRICEKCGEPHHVIFFPPKLTGQCNKCGGKLIQRTDDKDDVVRRRLEIFHQQNNKLLSYYQDRKNLKRLDADRHADNVQTDLSQWLA